jgi:DNA-binding response OmpR family regulator
MAYPFILVVDDDDLLAALVLQILEKGGYEARAVGDGAHMLEYLRTRRPDLIILDAQMPVMDGFEALVALRRDPLLAHIPVMMMTALRHHDHVLRLTAMGLAGYIVKPFDTNKLLDRVRVAIENHRKISSGASVVSHSLQDSEPKSAVNFYIQ